MADDKRYPATARKLRKAREDGDVAKSRDLTAALSLGFGALGIGIRMMNKGFFVDFFEKSLSLGTDTSASSVISYLFEAFLVFFQILVPCLALIFGVIFLVETMQVGLVVSWKAIRLDFNRLNLAAGLKRLLGLDEQGSSPFSRPLVDTAKLTFILVSIIILGVFIVTPRLSELDGEYYLYTEDVLYAFSFGALKLVAVSFLLLLVVGFFDYALVRKRRAKRLMMSAEELKRETREQEGSPEQQASRKQMHREIMLSDLIQGVRKSKVVVVNRGK